MTRAPALDAAVTELGRLGVRAVGVELVDHVEVKTPGATFCGTLREFDTVEDALGWACIVATVERGVLA